MPRPRTARWAALAALLAAFPAAAQSFVPYTPPPEFPRTGPLVDVALTAAPGTAVIDGQSYPALLFNNSLNAPVIRLEPGDELRVRFRNRLPAGDAGVSNLHYHGFAVSPLPPADNVTQIHVRPGGDYPYRMQIPADHPQGLFWYHPHPHKVSAPQVRSGLSGVITIGDPRRFFPRLPPSDEIFVMLKNFRSGSTNLNLINGARRITFPAVRPGRPQFWRVANISTERYFNLKVRGPGGRPVPFQVLARDGNVAGSADAPVVDTVMFMGPAQRFEIILAPTGPGAYILATEPADPRTGVTIVAETLGRFQVSAADQALAAAAPTAAFAAGGDPAESALIRALVQAPALVRDTFVFDFDTATRQFVINGKPYDPDVVNTRLELGRMYEWTLINRDVNIPHEFHIHQGDFLVVSSGGQPLPPDYRLDSVHMPPLLGGREQPVVIRFRYERPITVGPFVYHCHLLGHEDNAMMANVDLVTIPPE